MSEEQRPSIDPDGEGPILVPVDFSPHSEAALAWAARAAECWGGAIVILHVVNDPEAGPGYYSMPKRKKFLRRMEDAAREMMDEFVDNARQRDPKLDDADVSTKIVIGLPATRIVEVADKIGARLIVMGSQGRSGLERFLLGSKAQRVAQLARMPVTIVKTGAGV